MAEITIRHTHAEGTLIEGSRKGDGVWEILCALRRQGQGNWRSSRDIGLYLGQSRDKLAQTWKIDKAAEELRAAGHTVEVEIDDDAVRPVAEREQDAYDRAEARVDYHAGHAVSAARSADAKFERSWALLPDNGQPVLVGHHSERRHRAALERSENLMRASAAEAERSRYHADRAESSAQYEEFRKNPARTLRRLEKLRADRRRLVREIEGGAGLERAQRQLRDIDADIEHWETVIKQAEADGFKVWGPADFTKGDFVRYFGRWYEVERVNPKSLTVPHGNNDHLLPLVTRALVTHALGPSQWTAKVTYDEVKGRKSADEMKALIAAAKLAGQAEAAKELAP